MIPMHKADASTIPSHIFGNVQIANSAVSGRGTYFPGRGTGIFTVKKRAIPSITVEKINKTRNSLCIA
jgi:hypothetical protein